MSIGASIGPNIRAAIGERLRGAGLDPAVAAFAAESGATDLAGLNDLIKYVRSEGLINNFVIYPMKSAQNAGSGNTVYSLGGLTTNNMTLANSPTWGATGIAFNGVNQDGRILDFLETETITTFNRIAQNALPVSIVCISGQYASAGDERSFALFHEGSKANDPYQLNRSSNGASSSASFIELYIDGGSNYSANDRCLVAQWISGGGRSFWINKASQSLTLDSGTAQTERFNSSANITFASAAGSVYCNMSGVAFGLCNTSLTATQRETITDYINAL